LIRSPRSSERRAWSLPRRSGVPVRNGVRKTRNSDRLQPRGTTRTERTSSVSSSLSHVPKLTMRAGVNRPLHVRPVQTSGLRRQRVPPPLLTAGRVTPLDHDGVVLGSETRGREERHCLTGADIMAVDLVGCNEQGRVMRDPQIERRLSFGSVRQAIRVVLVVLQRPAHTIARRRAGSELQLTDGIRQTINLCIL
jgi:hypothetical protein